MTRSTWTLVSRAQPNYAPADMGRGSGRTRERLRIGIWDLDAQVGFLPPVLEQLSESQSAFAFFDVQAAIWPATLSSPTRTVAWADEWCEEPLSRSAHADLRQNVVYEDFAVQARQVCERLKLNTLLGMTKSMIAGFFDEEIHWNLFWAISDNCGLVSTADLREFAERAGRTPEMAVATHLVTSLLAEFAADDGVLHAELRGCIFDYNEDREGLIGSLRRPYLEEACERTLPRRLRGPAQQLIETLDTYRRAS